MFDSFFKLFVTDIAIDLGTANTLIYSPFKGIILNEPSVIAISHNLHGAKVVSIGREAKSIIGKTPVSITVVKPLKDGVIADFEVAEEMIRQFISKVKKSNGFRSLRIVICVPYGATQVERRAIRDAALSVGASQVWLIEEPMAAAIGAKVDIFESSGNMVVDIGGGTTEVGVISMGEIIYSQSIKVGGDKLDEALINYMKKNHNILIGEPTAERVKFKIGCALPENSSKNNDTYTVHGRNIIDGIPCSYVLTTNEVSEAYADSLSAIVVGIKESLENTPPELAADLMKNGITLCGGGALLKGLPSLLSKVTGLKVNIAEEPLNCVVNGSGLVIENLKQYIKILKD